MTAMAQAVQGMSFRCNQTIYLLAIYDIIPRIDEISRRKGD